LRLRRLQANHNADVNIKEDLKEVKTGAAANGI